MAGREDMLRGFWIFDSGFWIGISPFRVVAEHRRSNGRPQGAAAPSVIQSKIRNPKSKITHSVIQTCFSQQSLRLIHRQSHDISQAPGVAGDEGVVVLDAVAAGLALPLAG